MSLETQAYPEIGGEVTEEVLPKSIRLELKILPVVNYALQQNGIPIVQWVTIRNESGEPLKNVDLVITTAPEVCTSLTRHLEYVPTGRFDVREIPLQLNGEFLASLTEKVTGTITVQLVGPEVLAEASMPLTVLAYDEWHGYTYYPELLSAFVTPNHPEIVKIMARAAELLGSWTGDPSLDGYQSKDVNRVLHEAAAVYSALHEQNIVYSVPPASFELVGQRVRLCDAVFEQKLGTCLDLTLLYASCLEAIGLNPLLVIRKGHIFAGFWLEDLTFPEAVQDDVSLVTKRLAEGINELAVVECTSFVAGKDANFDEARRTAQGQMQGADAIEYVVDVKRARLSGVKPIPMRIRTENGWRVIREQGNDSSKVNAPTAVMGAINVDDAPKTPVTRKMRWERKLLDIGLRNTLINMRISKSVVPILASSLDDLEDSLSDGKDFSIVARPGDWHLPDGIDIDKLHELGQYEELVRSEFMNNRLRSILSDAELEKSVKELYRAARTSLEENGANTLFLALGLIKWFENPKSTKPRYAPIILVPVEMVRKSIAQGYVIRLRDDEPQINVTILEKIKQDFGITVEGLDVLPEDEHGIDTRKVFTIIRKAIMEQKNWDVLESAFLGLFSFSQFVMWNDIKNRSEDLERNRVVKSLMEGHLTWEAAPMELGEKVSEDEVLLPIPADASQLYAIDAAGKGESFVLHGPPGTGKSQTITAMIANALAQGKTVLFVALSVVQKRLEKIGLGAFCLELHSNKSKKKDVLEQLRQASEVTREKSPEMYQLDAERIAALRHDLDEYAAALHKKQPCGLSLYELINEFVANRNDESRNADNGLNSGTAQSERPGKDQSVTTIKAFDPALIDGMTYAKMEDLTALTERAVAAAKACGHPHAHPLSAVECREYSQQMRIRIPEINEKYRKAIETVGPKARTFSEMTGRTADTYEDLVSLKVVAQELLFWLIVPSMWVKKENLEDFGRRLHEFSAVSAKVRELKASLAEKWKPDFLNADGKALLDEYQTASAKWALPKYFGISGLAKKLALYTLNSAKPVKEEIPDQLLLLVNYQQTYAEYKGYEEKCSADLGNLYRGEETDWTEVLTKIDRAVYGARTLRNLTSTDEFRMNCCGQARFQVPAAEYLQAVTGLEEAKNEFDALFMIRQSTESGWLAAQQRLISSIEEHYDDIKEWISWNGIAAEACENGLTPVIEAYRAGMAHEDVVRAFRRELCQELAMKAIDSDKALSSFSGAMFSEKINQFMKLDADLQTLTQKEIYCRLAANVPNFSAEAAGSSELGIIRKAIKSGGRGSSIRKLFEQIPNVLPRLCPCMLMSPISAAQYLDPKREPFDIVIFDEASQLPTCKAVGALARGKSAVVVGDPNQMPPTSFFASNTVDEEYIEEEDLESILDDCLALSMPQTHLLWHYRSRHESLIAFSNHQFYENKLYTFPSVNDRETKVRLIHVDGVFDRGKTRQNRAEAEAVVAEIVRRCHDPKLSSQSVGVVTFNIMQQNLIDDLLTDACRTDAELENWAFHSEEPLFIKNLENVQGDERDVILFSVGYGVDASGKVSMNFGPLNREGGWRRLNVAVSRARCEMVVYSTLTPDQIDLSRTAAEGVAALRRFLEFADGQELAADEKSAQTAVTLKEDGGIAEVICENLLEAGYSTDRMVGHSEYKIDIGVIDPEDPERYLCGIILDGAAYGNAKTTRDREIAQISVLNGLGWSILRIWSMDWWDNAPKEIKRILEYIRKCEEEKKAKREQELREAEEEERKKALCEAEAKQERLLMENAAEKSNPPAEGSTDSGLVDGDSADAAQASIDGAERLAGKGSLSDDQESSADETAEEEGHDPSEESQEQKHYRARAKVYMPCALPVTASDGKEFLTTFAEKQEVCDRMNTIIAAEAPISERVLFRRIVQSFGVSRITPRIQEGLKQIAASPRVAASRSEYADNVVYWRSDQNPHEYYGMRANGEDEAKRDIQDVPVWEEVNAILYILQEQISLPGTDLAREAARFLGFARLNTNAHRAFVIAIQYASINDLVKESGNGWVLTEKGRERAKLVSEEVVMVEV